MRLNPGITRDSAGAHGAMHGRRQCSLTLHASSQNTLDGLERLVKSAKNLPGRKVLFFLSGGFLIENRRGDSISKLRDITNAAAKSGVVIYSMDTRGLVASSERRQYRTTFRSVRPAELVRQHGELFATQDGMNALAVDTGGKAIFNTNDLRKGLAPAIKETSTYYLLAWKPDAEAQKQRRFRNLEVKLINRPDLNVSEFEKVSSISIRPATGRCERISPTIQSQHQRPRSCASRSRRRIRKDRCRYC